MLKYITKDLVSMFRYLPYGLAAGIIVALVFFVINRYRIKKGKETCHVWAMTSFFAYAAIIWMITFLSRENGSRNGIDLELFSTWGINDRNNAFVIENILLFIPFGFAGAWAFLKLRKFHSIFLCSILTSLGIECMQLFSRRGYFQIDDILTNTLGGILGFFIFSIVNFFFKGQL